MSKQTLAWDYTDLAAHYDKRADYVGRAIDAMATHAGLQSGDRVAEVGAGTGKLTKELIARGLVVDAVEPNDAMRAIGSQSFPAMPGSLAWHAGAGEATGLPAHTFKAVWFGSSFNVLDQDLALAEVQRLARPGGWFVCLWNHRDLEDPLQASIESTIRSMVAGYALGRRREDQSQALVQSGVFRSVEKIERTAGFSMPVTDCLQAWRSHATLQRQAGDRFADVVSAIESLLPKDGDMVVPYTTRGWVAQLKA